MIELGNVERYFGIWLGILVKDCGDSSFHLHVYDCQIFKYRHSAKWASRCASSQEKRKKTLTLRHFSGPLVTTFVKLCLNLILKSLDEIDEAEPEFK